MLEKPKRKKGIQKKMNDKLDEAWSLAVKRLAGYKCEVCGKSSQLNSHHIVGRSNFALRWELRNGVCLCVSHHKWGQLSAHLDPIWFDKWLQENRAEDYKFLEDPANKGIRKWTIDNKIELLKQLTSTE